MSDSKIYVKLVKSGIGRPKKHKNILNNLRLTKLNKMREFKDTKAIRGMVAKVPHLVKIFDKC